MLTVATMTDRPALVPDTHVFLHGRNFNEVRWQQLLANSGLALAMPVIDELDAWKGKRADSQLASRARDLGRQINEVLGNGKTAGGILVETVPELTPAEVIALGFDAESKDHRLMAEVFAFRKSSGRDVRIVTTDNGMQIRCKSRGIPVIRFPEDLLLDVRDDRDSKIANLENEVKRLRKPLPKLELLADRGTHGEDELPVAKSFGPTPVLQDSKDRAKQEVAAAQHDLAYHRAGQFSTAEIARVQKELAAHEPQLAAYYASRSAAEDLLSRTFALDIGLANDGGAPAEDIDVHLQLPQGFSFIDETSLPTEPDKPATPMPVPEFAANFPYGGKVPDYMAGLLGGRDYLAGIRPLVQSLEPAANATGPRLDADDPTVAEMHVRTVKHGYGIELPRVHVLAPPNHPPAISVLYRLVAGNDPDPRDGKLAFKLEAGTTTQWPQDEENDR